MRWRSTATPLPSAIGIDDWAWRRRQRYGTSICDLERRRAIDLFPDREPATVEARLSRHPQIEVVARDRNCEYGGAVTRALPNTVQVADRWQLLEISGVAFLAAVRRAMTDIRKAVGAGRLVGILTAASACNYEGSLRRQHTNRMACPSAGGKCPPAGRIARMTAARHHLSRADAIAVVRIQTAVSILATARDLTERFAEMVRHGRAEQLPD